MSSTTPITVTLIIWSNEVGEVSIGGGWATITKRINLGSTSDYLIQSVVYRGSVELAWSGITYASATLFVDGVQKNKQEWFMVGGRRDIELNLTTELSGGGLHDFSYYLWCFGSNRFIINGYLEVTYVKLNSSAPDIGQENVSTPSAPTSVSYGIVNIFRFVEQSMPIIFMVLTVVLLRTLMDIFRGFGLYKETKREKE